MYFDGYLDATDGYEEDEEDIQAYEEYRKRIDKFYQLEENGQQRLFEYRKETPIMKHADFEDFPDEERDRDEAYEAFWEEQEFLKDFELEQAMIKIEKQNMTPPYSEFLERFYGRL